MGNISEDILKDGRKQYENGLPQDGNISLLQPTDYQSVVPLNQSLIYAFDTTGEQRDNQDVGYDGYDDAEEASLFPSSFSGLLDPANDNYQYYLGAEGNVLERYKRYNGLQGNSPDNLSDTDRGSTTFPDVEDVNRDNTMNTIDSYFEYKMNISPASLNLNTNEFIVDSKTVTRFLPDGSDIAVNWYQFRIPVTVPLSTYDDPAIPEYSRVGGITDFRSIRFARVYLNQFTTQTTMRFGTFDLETLH